MLPITGSPAGALGRSSHKACGIFLPQPGIEPRSSALKGGFLTTRWSGKLRFAGLNYASDVSVPGISPKAELGLKSEAPSPSMEVAQQRLLGVQNPL